jgi:hypothetical protein
MHPRGFLRYGALISRAPNGWVFDSHKATRHEDEYGYRFGTHIFRFGEYVSIQDEQASSTLFEWFRWSRRVS